eukprot:scaffold39473_cov26-Tisochrysis_lutea.AAC.4
MGVTKANLTELLIVALNGVECGLPFLQLLALLIEPCLQCLDESLVRLSERHQLIHPTGQVDGIRTGASLGRMREGSTASRAARELALLRARPAAELQILHVVQVCRRHHAPRSPLESTAPHPPAALAALTPAAGGRERAAEAIAAAADRRGRWWASVLPILLRSREEYE